MRIHQTEIRLKKEGFFNIAGIDEAGRGPWAGPLVAAAVILPRNIKLPKLNDSKKLTAERKIKIFSLLLKSAYVGVGIISHLEIDKKGLAYALKLAYEKAIGNLPVEPDYILIDGIGRYNFETPYQTIKRGDNKVRCIAAASVVAKVVRDTIMESLGEKFNKYEFHIHKGYGTKRHQQNLLKYGVSSIHRKSFKPIKNLLSEAENK